MSVHFVIVINAIVHVLLYVTMVIAINFQFK